jgi:hypothetical protein
MRPFSSFDLLVFTYAASFTPATSPSTVEPGSLSWFSITRKREPLWPVIEVPSRIGGASLDSMLNYDVGTSINAYRLTIVEIQS